MKCIGQRGNQEAHGDSGRYNIICTLYKSGFYGIVVNRKPLLKWSQNKSQLSVSYNPRRTKMYKENGALVRRELILTFWFTANTGFEVENQSRMVAWT